MGALKGQSLPHKMLTVALAVFALFLPIYGLLLDHHFAERQPDHEHFYLGRDVPDHVHPYHVPHTHSNEAGSRGPQDLFKGDPAPDGIVFLTSHNGVGQGFAQLTTPSIHLALDFPSRDDTRSTFGIPADDTSLQDAYLALPKKPPRV